MVKPPTYLTGIVVGVALAIHFAQGWTPLSQPFASSTFDEPSSWNPTRNMPFGRKSMQRNSSVGTTRLHGVLSRSTILKHKSSKNKGKKNEPKTSSSRKEGSSNRSRAQANMESEHITMTFLMDAVEEAIYRQTIALECLDIEREKLELMVGKFGSIEQENSNLDATNEKNIDVRDNGGEREMSKKEKNPRIALEKVATRRIEISKRVAVLEKLRRDLVNSGGIKNSSNCDGTGLTVATAESRFRAIMGSEGKSCSILDRSKSTWKIVLEQARGEFGRPKGFTGLIFYSPLGVPILIGKPKADSDGILRRASQGSDLWFQVEDYDGSRVLLRSSLVRGTKDSKRCMQMAADFAAFFSVWGGGHHQEKSDYFDSIPVMYTDSKHVAKRGTKVGRMRKKKSMGRLMGRPSRVEGIARGLEPS